jgi:predicted outer membrane repeat protein
MKLSYATVDGNSAQQEGGGIYCDGRLIVNKSTVSNNRVVLHESGYTGGGASGRDINVFDSTFSGNEAPTGSAIWARDVAKIANSTIVFNRETLAGPESAGAVVVYHLTFLAGGAAAAAPVFAYDISSSIIARNQWNGGPGNDLGPDETYAARGANNIIERSPIPVPADTISADPLLVPLANNGGPTKTHALRNGSPAIDRGNNRRHRQYDQRGPGFIRVVGTAPDIGAFELCAADSKD